jgi:hypothetical protein
LQLNEFLNGKSVDLVYQGKPVRLYKKEIFGYRLNNQNFRFYNNEAYAIIDTAGFILYSRQKLTQSNKGYKPIKRYFFSSNYNQPILDLTIANLYKSFPESVGFRYSLQNYFHNDDDLATFDPAENQYKLKYVYFEHKSMAAAHPAK